MYKVRLDGDNFTVENEENGQCLSQSEWSELVVLVNRSYRRQQRRIDLSSFLSEAAWIYPQSRSDLRASGNCVYFLTHESRPGLIKIGSTKSLTSRTKGLQKTLKGNLPSVIVFVRCYECLKLERGIQNYFDPNRAFQGKGHQSEWFSITTHDIEALRKEYTND